MPFSEPWVHTIKSKINISSQTETILSDLLIQQALSYIMCEAEYDQVSY